MSRGKALAERDVSVLAALALVDEDLAVLQVYVAHFDAAQLSDADAGVEQEPHDLHRWVDRDISGDSTVWYQVSFGTAPGPTPGQEGSYCPGPLPDNGDADGLVVNVPNLLTLALAHSPPFSLVLLHL